MDDRGRRCPLGLKSKIEKRVIGSTIETKAIRLGEALEMAVSQRDIGVFR